jgi:hypothetical protein
MPGFDSRCDGRELLDTVSLAPRSMCRALAFLALTDRWFGGSRLVVRHPERWVLR